jgi:hypothetical protein
VTVHAIQDDAVQRDARTLYLRACPITDGPHGRFEGGLLECVAEKRLVYGNRDLTFAAYEKARLGSPVAILSGTHDPLPNVTDDRGASSDT